MDGDKFCFASSKNVEIPAKLNICDVVLFPIFLCGVYCFGMIATTKFRLKSTEL